MRAAPFPFNFCRGVNQERQSGCQLCTALCNLFLIVSSFPVYSCSFKAPSGILVSCPSRRIEIKLFFFFIWPIRPLIPLRFWTFISNIGALDSCFYYHHQRSELRVFQVIIPENTGWQKQRNDNFLGLSDLRSSKHLRLFGP